ncbi:hypothetical protein L7F22_035246 [Adiantum nelumboides]|nr:hypothetical protein [Adiantum nelumboides]
MSSSRFTPVLGTFGGLETCYKLPSQDLKLVEGLPLVEFIFEGGASLPLDRHNFLRYFEGGDLHCFIFLSQPEEVLNGVTVIGDVQMQGTEWTFDMANKKIGFLTGVCLD